MAYRAWKKHCEKVIEYYEAGLEVIDDEEESEEETDSDEDDDDEDNDLEGDFEDENGFEGN